MILLSLFACALTAAVAASPTAATKKPPKEPPRVYLTAPFGGSAEGIKGSAAWEEGPMTISSSDLLFATSAGNTECAMELPVEVVGNTRWNPSLIGVTPGSLPCNGTVGSESTELKTQEWSMNLTPSDKVFACIDRPVEGLVYECGERPVFRASVVRLGIGSLECTYTHATNRYGAAMIGSFAPAALDSAEPRTVEITLPAEKFKLEHEQRKSSAYSNCPREGQLSGNFKVQTEHDGPVQARVVDAQQAFFNPPDPCSLIGLGLRCTFQFTNYDQTESVEVREIEMTQDEVLNEEGFLRVPTAGECAGSVQSANPTILSPGESCRVVIEDVNAGRGSYDLLITTSSQPGGAPDHEFAGLP